MTARTPAQFSADLLSSCPLCAAPNACALEAGEKAESCWCMSAAVAPEALARLSLQARGLRCLCAACAQGNDQPASAPV